MSADHLRVWVNNKPVGRLARHGNGATFSYDEGVDPSQAISLTMPVRVASYNTEYGMLPVFDTNLPEGALMDKIRSALSKAHNSKVDAIDVLTITGGNQIGRIRVLPDGEEPVRRRPIGKISEILDREACKDLVEEITERYALRSGVSGAMPKVLIDDMAHEDHDTEVHPFGGDDDEEGHRSTIQTRDYILKFDDVDYPGLSLNEFHCLEVARTAGLNVAEAELSRDGKMLAVKRFDEVGDERSGFEDFASLNGQVSEEKYQGNIEKNLFKKLESVSGKDARKNMEDLYKILVTNIGLRNGDAHLKNFAVLFEDAKDGAVKLAPAYDIVTTRAWIKADMMALKYSGTNRWPNEKSLIQMGARAKLPPARAKEIIQEIGTAIQERIPVMTADLEARGMGELAKNIRDQWNDGLTKSFNMEPVEIEAELETPSL
ncbi:MAG: type II toxin-antitoxin system HipA family toxin [Roseibium sp.]|uniref:type II toxin-antitoxin system HipA family toxin n=1 Tax=Roseibium sp. TaxID=1936156 RepID=UPI00329786E1